MRALHYTVFAVQAIAAATVAILAAPCAIGAEMSASCPAKLPTRTFVPDQPPAGWIGYVPGPLHLTASGMMAGPPEGLEYLVPATDVRDIQVFNFQRGDRQRWLWCAYAGGVQISRRLDDNATSCTVTTAQKMPGLLASASVRCK